MNTFKCYACGNTVYFENIRCLKCGHALGFEPLGLDMATLGPPSGTLYREIRRAKSARYAYCANMLFPPRESLGHCALNLRGRGRVSAVEEARCMAHRHGRATLGVETTGWRHPSDVWSRD